MNKKTSLWITVVVAAFTALIMVGCGKTEDTGKTGSGNTSAASLPENLFLAAAPGESIAVKQVKEQAQAGDEVVVRAVVGGEVNVFVEDRAIVKVIDTEMKNPCLSKDDHCKTPWDYCCSTNEELRPHRATVRIVDGEGKTLKVGLKGSGRIEELKTLVVKGIVAEGSDLNNLVINAEGIYVEN